VSRTSWPSAHDHTAPGLLRSRSGGPMPNPQKSNPDDQMADREEDRIRGVASEEDEFEDTEDLDEDDTDDSEDSGDV